jgi:hypothetical protein
VTHTSLSGRWKSPADMHAAMACKHTMLVQYNTNFLFMDFKGILSSS